MRRWILVVPWLLLVASPLWAAEITLQGFVTYFETGIPIPGVTVTLNTPTETVSSITDAQGRYSLTLSAFAGPTATWELSRSSTTKDQLAISESDEALINQYLAGSSTLSYYQLRAADVNQDSKVNSLDAFAISQWLVAVTDPASHTGTWVFERRRSKDDDVYDFTGGLFGDVDLSWAGEPLPLSEWTWSQLKNAFR